MTSILIKWGTLETDRHTGGVSQEAPKIASKPPETRRETWVRYFLPSEGINAALIWDFWPLELEEKKFCCLVHSIYGTCYGHSSKLIQAPKLIRGKGLVRLREDFAVEVLSELSQISRVAWVGPGEPFHIK